MGPDDPDNTLAEILRVTLSLLDHYQTSPHVEPEVLEAKSSLRRAIEALKRPSSHDSHPHSPQ